MIISASRRTDIPAFYGDWFARRIEEGFAVVRNPFDSRPVKIPLDPSSVDVIVFWTKNPRPFFPVLDRLDEKGYRYWFRFTVNGYGRDIEPRIDTDDAVETFAELSRRLGKHGTVWAYDPVLFAPGIDERWHTDNFSRLASRLGELTDSCIISFYDDYRSADAARAGIFRPDKDAIARLCGAFAAIAGDRFGLQSCADDIPLPKGACISRERAERLCGYRMDIKKDTGQRAGCRCVQSADIGCYDSCPNFCRYCYANHGMNGVTRRTAAYDPDSPVLLDVLRPGETVTEQREDKSFRQLNMFGAEKQ